MSYTGHPPGPMVEKLTEAVMKLQKENATLREALTEIRDLCRTGCAPMSWNMPEAQWLGHKVNKSAALADRALAKGSES